jgi:hypothetical protein
MSPKSRRSDSQFAQNRESPDCCIFLRSPDQISHRSYGSGQCSYDRREMKFRDILRYKSISPEGLTTRRLKIHEQDGAFACRVYLYS